MKYRRALLMLALAVVSGLAAVMLASRWLLRQTPNAERVVVAAADVSLGQRLTPDMLKLSDWPSDSLPAGAVRDPSTLNGRVLKTSIVRGEALTEARLAPAGTMGGLSALIGEGKRAITVRVNDLPCPATSSTSWSTRRPKPARSTSMPSPRSCWNGFWCWPWHRK
jgi:pilus assembly protein CpaB